MINMNTVIENTIKNKYILESDLEYLDSQYFVYLQSLYEINEISRKFKEFDFSSTDTRYDYPKQPFIRITDKEWLNVYKEIYLLNIDEAK